MMPDFVQSMHSAPRNSRLVRINACNKQISISFNTATTRKTATTRRLPPSNHISNGILHAQPQHGCGSRLSCAFPYANSRPLSIAYTLHGRRRRRRRGRITRTRVTPSTDFVVFVAKNLVHSTSFQLKKAIKQPHKSSEPMQNRIRLLCKLHHQLWWHQLLHRTWAFSISFDRVAIFREFIAIDRFRRFANVLSIRLNAFNFSRFSSSVTTHSARMLGCAFKWNGKLSRSVSVNLLCDSLPRRIKQNLSHCDDGAGGLVSLHAKHCLAAYIDAGKYGEWPWWIQQIHV